MIGQKDGENFGIDRTKTLRFKDRMYVPNNEEIKKMILEEAHKSKLSKHLGTTKMYQDLKKVTPTTRIGRVVKSKKLTPR